MNHFLKISFATLLTITSLSAWASSDEAKKMQVQISNQTSENCQLTKTDVRHGKLLSPAPLSIPKGTSGGFTAEQGTLRGPSVILSYSCGPDEIIFKSHQHLVKATGSTPEASIINEKNMNLRFDAVSSSVLHNKAGILNVTLTSK